MHDLIYRIIRNGELEAINIADKSNVKNIENRKTFTLKGHYRIERTTGVIVGSEDYAALQMENSGSKNKDH